MELSIIIVNWNSKEFLRKCIESIFVETNTVKYEVIVIDAASFDGCGEMLRESYPQVRFIQGEHNLGFAGANNLAFEIASGSAILFLNPDTEVRDHAIDTLYKNLMSLPKAGVLGCKLLNSDTSVQTSCIQSVPTILNQLLNCEFLRQRLPFRGLWGMGHKAWASREPCPVDAVSGACIMLHRNVFLEAGRFRTDYFMYAEDVDLCFEVQKRGWINYCVPMAEVMHHGGSSSGQAGSDFSIVMMCHSILKFLRRTRGAFYAMGYRVAMLFSSVSRIGGLLILSPFHAGPNEKEKWKASVRKWRAILRWSIMPQPWLKRYN